MEWEIPTPDEVADALMEVDPVKTTVRLPRSTQPLPRSISSVKVNEGFGCLYGWLVP